MVTSSQAVLTAFVRCMAVPNPQPVTAAVVVVLQQAEEPDDFFRPQSLPNVKDTSPRHAAQVRVLLHVALLTIAQTVPSSRNRQTDCTKPGRLQVARDRQTGTLQQALAAMAGCGRGASHARPLPHIYGSAEYLQDAQAWLRHTLTNKHA